MFKKLSVFVLLLLLSFNLSAMPVNINQAEAQEISKLTGVGPAKANAIVEYRNTHGEFKNLQDLTKVRGIGQRTLEINADNIILSTPES